MLDLHGVTTLNRPAAQALDVLGEASLEKLNSSVFLTQQNWMC